MYDINDEAFAIREVQRFLLIIAEEDNNIPYIAVDGIYTEELANIIKDYQNSRGIFPSGKVDNKTFDILYYESSQVQKRNNTKQQVIGDIPFPLKIGDSGSDVAMLNTNLIRLGEHYIDIPLTSYGSFFKQETEDAVKYMQVIFGDDVTGQVDEVLFVRISDELHEREKFILK